MNKNDLDYLGKCLAQGFIKSPCLEIGVCEDHDGAQFLRQRGIEYFGADLRPGPNVDFSVNFGESFESINQVLQGRSFKTVLALNLLEHTFNPIDILDNIFRFLDVEGNCVITTPVVWPLHDYPVDCWRINPNFYEQYCQARSLDLVYDLFEYLAHGPVRNGSHAYCLPAPAEGWKHVYSRVVHKLFNTSGRGMFFPSHVSVGVVIRKPAQPK